VVQGAVVHYAEKFNALLFEVEHRFYGESQPTNDLSVANLKYLSSEQALADLAHFIEVINKKYGFDKSTKWIAFGGSYAGSLTAWLRQRYPELVYGAVSTSGPLLAKVDFTEYFDVVTSAIEKYSPECTVAIKKSFDQIDVLLKSTSGQRVLDKKFKLCSPVKQSVDNPLDVAGLFEGLASNFAFVAQYNNDNDGIPYTITQICDVMNNASTGPEVNRLAAVNQLLLDVFNSTCFEYKYDTMIQEMRNVSWNSSEAAGTRQWTYQTCNEFGFYQTSEDKKKLFGDRFSIDLFIKQCTDIYGSNFNVESLNELIEHTNEIYGGLSPNTTNVIYVHGSADPWHPLGLFHSNNPFEPTIYIEGTAHCADLYEPRDTDFPQLKEARKKIIKFLTHLLK